MTRFLVALAACSALAAPAFAAPVLGQPAPAFQALDASGKTRSLSEFKGKTVVLEWTNNGCPYVQKHYNSANMQSTQKAATAKGVVWLSVDSTTRDASDYRSPADLAAWMQQHKAGSNATLRDNDGTIGRAYGARTTPHMYVIDPAGKLVYIGAIDSKPTANPSDIATATNYVNQALAESMAGKPVSVATTRAYGCSVKYGSM